MKPIEDWRNGWKLYTAWAWAVVLAFPEFYAMAAALMPLSEMPASAEWSIRALAIGGLFVRFVRQKRPTDETDQAGA